LINRFATALFYILYIIELTSRTGGVIMEITIMSRREVMDFARTVNNGLHAVISITDIDSSPPLLQREGNGISKVCYLQFDDVTQGQENGITSRDAERIAAFVKSLDKNNVKLIVHCEFGQSRSAAVAAAVSLVVNGSDDWVFNDKRYYPNMICYRKVLKAFKYKKSALPKHI
jgi:rhodanese-related sulfurtransferase